MPYLIRAQQRDLVSSFFLHDIFREFGFKQLRNVGFATCYVHLSSYGSHDELAFRFSYRSAPLLVSSFQSRYVSTIMTAQGFFDWKNCDFFFCGFMIDNYAHDQMKGIQSGKSPVIWADISCMTFFMFRFQDFVYEMKWTWRDRHLSIMFHICKISDVCKMQDARYLLHICKMYVKI